MFIFLLAPRRLRDKEGLALAAFERSLLSHRVGPDRRSSLLNASCASSSCSRPAPEGLCIFIREDPPAAGRGHKILLYKLLII